MKKKIFIIIEAPKYIANHLVGENHTLGHRKIIGVVVMIGGVGIAKITHYFSYFEFVGDLLGYAIHGIGLTPFITSVEIFSKDKVKEVETKIEEKIEEIVEPQTEEK